MPSDRQYRPNRDTYSGRLADRVDCRMRKKMLSDREVAAKLGVDMKQFSKWKRGEEPFPLDILPALAQALFYGSPKDLVP